MGRGARLSGLAARGLRKVFYHTEDGGGRSASLLPGWDNRKAPEASPTSSTPGVPDSHPLPWPGGPWTGSRRKLAVPPTAWWAPRRDPRETRTLRRRWKPTAGSRSQRNGAASSQGTGMGGGPGPLQMLRAGTRAESAFGAEPRTPGLPTSLSHSRCSAELGVRTVPRPDLDPAAKARGVQIFFFKDPPTSYKCEIVIRRPRLLKAYHFSAIQFY